MEKHELVNVWRKAYHEKRGDTGCLDCFLISGELLPEIRGIKINPSSLSDDSIVSLQLKTQEKKSTVMDASQLAVNLFSASTAQYWHNHCCQGNFRFSIKQ